MSDGMRPGGGSTDDPADLLAMVFAQPRRAVSRARALLAAGPSDRDASIAYQVLGLVERDFGDLTAAIAHLRRAVRLARRCGSAGRVGDALASLGLALIHHGRTASGLATLREAVGLVRGHAAARVRFRLAGALWVLGRHDQASQQVGRAIPGLRRAGDAVWVARALTLRALLHLAAGAADRADRDFAAAERLFADTGQQHDRAVAVHNRGLVALRAGDLPAALAQLADAGARYRALGTPMPDHDIDYCTALLSAGLDTEALALADRAIARWESQRGQPTRRAELLLTAAQAALAAGEPATAGVRAGAACRLFAAQRRDRWYAQGRLLVLESRLAAGSVDARLPREATRCADRLSTWSTADAVPAYLLAFLATIRWCQRSRVPSGDDTSPAQRHWQHSGQRGQCRPVRPVQARPRVPAAQHGDLVRVTRAALRPSMPTSGPAAPARTRRRRTGDRSDRPARSPIIPGHGRWLSLRPAQSPAVRHCLTRSYAGRPA